MDLKCFDIKLSGCFGSFPGGIRGHRFEIGDFYLNHFVAKSRNFYVEGATHFHASSLGEFEQGRPLMEELKRRTPEVKIVLTFFSPSGYEVRKNYAGADVILYLPMDTPENAARFLDIVKPVKAVFIKYEFWANYLTGLKKRNIPTYLVSAIFRPKQAFFKWYGGWYRNLLSAFTHLYVQDKASEELLKTIGVTNVTVAGDTRFDRVAEIAAQAKNLPLVEAFANGRKVLVAGSSWPLDEDILFDYFNTHKDLHLIVAPHACHY